MLGFNLFFIEDSLQLSYLYNFFVICDAEDVSSDKH